MAQWIEHLTSNQEVAGSSPARGKYFYFINVSVAQWLAYRSSKPGVASSSLARDL